MAVPRIDRTMVLILGFADEHLPEQALLTTDLRSFAARTASFLEALASGHQSGTIACTVDGGNGVAATGTVTLSSVTGTAATGTITFSSASGTTTQTINGVTGFSQTTGDDTARAAALAAAITASTDPLIAGVLTASAALGVVTLTAVVKGTGGNALTLAVTGTGCAASGATLAGGANNAVTVTINGVAVATTTTTAASDTAAAALVASSINNSANPLVNQHVTATSALGVVTLTYKLKGAAGNSTTLSSSATSGTATASGARLTGGTNATDNTVTI